MTVSYNVKFRKVNFSGKLLIEKEGEIVFDRKYFRLKGKGANDHGEVIHFTDIRESKKTRDKFTFITFSRDTYELSHFGDSVENFLIDYYKIRNDFWAETMFMREGMLVGQFDCSIELSNRLGKSVNKGISIMQIYEGSILFIPKTHDAFSINLNFLRHHEFLDDEYLLQIETDTYTKINVFKLGSHFDECKEVLEGCMEKMYQRVLTNLNEVLPGFSLQTLLKVAYAIKTGKAVNLASFKKIDASLPQKLIDLAFGENPEILQKLQFIRGLDKEEKFFLGLNFHSGTSEKDVVVHAWFISVLPSLNLVAMGTTNNSENQQILFLRLVTGQIGVLSERLESKILEINRSMILLKHDFSPLLVDKNSFKKSRYRVAVMRMNFLRLFRRSILGLSQGNFSDKFKNDVNRMIMLAKTPVRTMRHRRNSAKYVSTVRH